MIGQIVTGNLHGDAVELDVTGGVGDEGWAGRPVAGAFDGNAVFVEERHAFDQAGEAFGLRGWWLVLQLDDSVRLREPRQSERPNFGQI